MKHLRVALLTITAAAILFIIVSYSAQEFFKTILRYSQFRLTVAMNANRFTGQTVSLIVGDSRMMDGVNAAELNKQHSIGTVYNAAFNGVEYPEALDIVQGFVASCGCELSTVLIDESALWEETPGVSETEIFLSGFSDYAKDLLRMRDPRKAWYLNIFPALYFNNEVTLRSLYYLVMQRDDQDHGNSYRFRVPKNRIASIGTEPKINRITVSDVQRMAKIVAEAHGKLVVVIPPHHPVYTSGRMGYGEYVESVKQVVLQAGAQFQDHSRLYSDHPEYFADLIHLHIDGQKEYSRYLSKHTLAARGAL
jgi:hypothetical protein